MADSGSRNPQRHQGDNVSRKSPHFFSREADGSVRFRMRLNPELAALIEEAAGETQLMLYISRVLKERAQYHIRKRAEVEASQGRLVSLDEPDPEDIEDVDTGGVA